MKKWFAVFLLGVVAFMAWCLNQVGWEETKYLYHHDGLVSAWREVINLRPASPGALQYRIANQLFRERGDNETDTRACAWYRRAAQLGHRNAAFNLADSYETGQGCRQDDAQAAKWFEQVARQGDSDGQVRLGHLYQTGLGVPKNEREAARWYRMAVRQGSPGASVNLSLMYKDGLGVAKDEGEAFRLMRKAAEQGSPDAAENLGRFYLQAIGTPRDLDAAEKWLSRAAQQGFPLPHYLLGWIRIERGGAENDIDQHLQFAAERGVRGAQYLLGQRLARRAEGDRRQWSEALRWFGEAAKQGCSPALNAVTGFMQVNKDVFVDRTWVAQVEAGFKSAFHQRKATDSCY